MVCNLAPPPIKAWCVVGSGCGRRVPCAGQQGGPEQMAPVGHVGGEVVHPTGSCGEAAAAVEAAGHGHACARQPPHRRGLPIPMRYWPGQASKHAARYLPPTDPAKPGRAFNSLVTAMNRPEDKKIQQKRRFAESINKVQNAG